MEQHLTSSFTPFLGNNKRDHNIDDWTQEGQGEYGQRLNSHGNDEQEKRSIFCATRKEM